METYSSNFPKKFSCLYNLCCSKALQMNTKYFYATIRILGKIKKLIKLSFMPETNSSSLSIHPYRFQMRKSGLSSIHSFYNQILAPLTVLFPLTYFSRSSKYHVNHERPIAGYPLNCKIHAKKKISSKLIGNSMKKTEIKLQ